MKKINIFFVLFLFSNILFAQEEYFVSIDPTTCNYTIIDSIPGVKWIYVTQSTFDKINKRYIVRCEDAYSNSFLYSIDATNGHVLSNPQFPNPNANGFQDFRFDNSSGILYGLHWTGINGNIDLITVNPTNGNYSIINTITNLTGIGLESTIDEINHRLLFVGGDSNFINCLFSIDVVTGHIVSKPQLSTNISNLVFDNSSGNLYGLKIDNSTQGISFCLINPTNGNYNIIDTIPYDLSGGIPMWGLSTFDEINHRYTFSGDDINNNQYLFTIDATNGHVISHPPFPIFIDPYNLVEPRYDNSTGILYGLHWGPISEMPEGIKEQNNQLINQSSLSVSNPYPNPNKNSTTIDYTLPAGINQGEIVFYNLQGAEVKRFKVDRTFSNLLVSTSDIAAGTYFYQLQTSAQNSGGKKMVVIK